MFTQYKLLPRETESEFDSESAINNNNNNNNDDRPSASRSIANF